MSAVADLSQICVPGVTLSPFEIGCVAAGVLPHGRAGRAHDGVDARVDRERPDRVTDLRPSWLAGVIVRLGGGGLTIGPALITAGHERRDLRRGAGRSY